MTGFREGVTGFLMERNEEKKQGLPVVEALNDYRMKRNQAGSFLDETDDFRYSRFNVAMNLTEISLGHAASHS